ncbi:hypothetical protein [Clostridium grantii]|uniref:Uncharacterized protein n=1 Tax=Clostridium grantii DSM 8605 TaxID=1121316 RepID=A0A1M5X7D8_9CLOT|nr:hypothetical protein [Clostridium grantii]SHH95701.1 hypothetical protein SAMN02745207_03423 [Clostridium grantii DSM 8605]
MVKDGELKINLYGKENNLIEELPSNVEETYEITFGGDGSYVIELIGIDTKGSYSIEIEGME